MNLKKKELLVRSSLRLISRGTFGRARTFQYSFYMSVEKISSIVESVEPISDFAI